jgi:hypothetical protein
LRVPPPPLPPMGGLGCGGAGLQAPRAWWNVCHAFESMHLTVFAGMGARGGKPEGDDPLGTWGGKPEGDDPLGPNIHRQAESRRGAPPLIRGGLTCSHASSCPFSRLAINTFKP